MRTLRKRPERSGGLKGQAVSPQQSFQQTAAFRQDTKHLRSRPGYVPEKGHWLLRGGLLDEARQQRKVKVMDPYRRRLFAELVEDGICEAPVQRTIGVPECFTIGYAIQRDVTERPEHLVRVTQVAPFHLFGCQPNPAEPVRRRLSRDFDYVPRTHRFAISLSTPPGNPGPPQTTQHRIKRRRQTTISALAHHTALESPVLVGLPIRHDDQWRSILQSLLFRTPVRRHHCVPERLTSVSDHRVPGRAVYRKASVPGTLWRDPSRPDRGQSPRPARRLPE